MANQIVRKGNNEPTDVFGAMRSEMERMFDRFNQGWGGFPDVFTAKDTQIVPRLDVKDTGKAIVVEVELPGVDEKDVSVTVHDGVLTIQGEKQQKKEEKNENHYLMERSYGSFMRSIRLPETIDEDKVQAKFEKGVLKVIAEKRPEAVKKEKRIEIGKG